MVDFGDAIAARDAEIEEISRLSSKDRNQISGSDLGIRGMPATGSAEIAVSSHQV
jgi:hypothetical protein